MASSIYPAETTSQHLANLEIDSITARDVIYTFPCLYKSSLSPISKGHLIYPYIKQLAASRTHFEVETDGIHI